jgi:hypothetical protein
MPTIQQSSTDESTLTFRCNSKWKRKVVSEAALKGKTIRTVCVEAISKHLGVPMPKEDAAV